MSVKIRPNPKKYCVVYRAQPNLEWQVIFAEADNVEELYAEIESRIKDFSSYLYEAKVHYYETICE